MENSSQKEYIYVFESNGPHWFYLSNKMNGMDLAFIYFSLINYGGLGRSHKPGHLAKVGKSPGGNLYPTQTLLQKTRSGDPELPGSIIFLTH